MKTHDVQKAAWRGAFSNYGRVVLRMVLGLVTFRLLYQGLDAESFGFWSLLWSVFGYGILLDFGFGSAAQKRVAEALADQDWAQLSRALSTIFFFYVGVALVIGVLGWWLAGPLVTLLGVPPDQLETYRPAARAFFLGMALGFPSGIFPEVLRGLQRMETANRIAMVGLVANAILIAVALFLKWNLVALITVALACVLIPDLVAGWMALRSMPEVKLKPSLFSMGQLMSTSKFSLFVWASTMSHVLRNKSDQLVIGLLISLPAVALYQAAGKVSEMFGMGTKQVSDALSPAAAYLHADGRGDVLKDFFMNGLRLTVLVATPAYVCAAVHLDFLVYLLTGDAAPASSTLLVGQLLLLWFYQMSFTHLVFRRMFMMCGQERRLMWQGLSEGALNIGLSIVLTLWMGTIVGVALGSLIPAVVLGWTILWPWAARQVGLGKMRLFRDTCGRTILACLPMVAVGLGVRWLSGLSYGEPQWIKSLTGLVLMLLTGGIGLWTVALNAGERSRVLGVVRRIFSRSKVAKAGGPV